MVFGREKRGQLAWDTLIPWIIALGVLILILMLYLGLSDKGKGLLEYLKNLLRFGR